MLLFNHKIQQQKGMYTAKPNMNKDLTILKKK